MTPTPLKHHRVVKGRDIASSVPEGALWWNEKQHRWEKSGFSGRSLDCDWLGDDFAVPSPTTPATSSTSGPKAAEQQPIA